MVITGGSGFIGHHLVQHFTDAGWEVRAPSRPSWALGAPLGDLAADADVVLHGALVGYDRPDAHEANVGGSEALIREFRDRGHGRFIFISSIAATPDAPSRYGRDKFAIQSTLTGPNELAIRPGLVLGEAGLFERVRRLVSRAPIVPLVGGRQRFQTVYVGDLVAAIDAAVELGVSGVVTVAEPEPVEFRALLGEAARLMGRRVRFIPIPFWAVDAALRTAGLLHLRMPVSSDNLAGLRGVRPESVAADLQRLGVTARDYRASLAAILGQSRP